MTMHDQMVTHEQATLKNKTDKMKQKSNNEDNNITRARIERGPPAVNSPIILRQAGGALTYFVIT
jgi:hypothetical protein